MVKFGKRGTFVGPIFFVHLFVRNMEKIVPQLKRNVSGKFENIFKKIAKSEKGLAIVRKRIIPHVGGFQHYIII